MSFGDSDSESLTDGLDRLVRVGSSRGGRGVFASGGGAKASASTRFLLPVVSEGSGSGSGRSLMPGGVAGPADGIGALHSGALDPARRAVRSTGSGHGIGSSSRPLLGHARGGAAGSFSRSFGRVRQSIRGAAGFGLGLPHLDSSVGFGGPWGVGSDSPMTIGSDSPRMPDGGTPRSGGRNSRGGIRRSASRYAMSFSGQMVELFDEGMDGPDGVLGGMSGGGDEVHPTPASRIAAAV